MYNEWTLKVTDTTSHKEAYIHSRAKVHCYATDEPERLQYKRWGYRLCDEEAQEMDYYDTFDIEWVYKHQDKVCKRCLKEFNKRKW